MPKIRKQTISVRHGEVSKNFDLTTMYDQEDAFYIELPIEFKSLIHHTENSELDGLQISKKYRSKYGRYDADMDSYKAIVSANNEQECLSKAKAAIKHFMDKIIAKRNVIIVFYYPKASSSYNRHYYNPQYDQIGIQFGLTYAVESSVGDKKVYSMYRTSENNPEHMRELSLWGDNSTIIDDTEENRRFLEQLYDALKALNEKISSFTKNEESLINMISSGVKLLSN